MRLKRGRDPAPATAAAGVFVPDRAQATTSEEIGTMPAISQLLHSLSALAAGLALAAPSAAADKLGSVRVDWAYNSPVSLVLRDKGWMEAEFAKDGTKVEWVLSLGSNKALEFLNGNNVDFGSSAGAAALLAKANGAPIKAVYVFDKPEWTALVTPKYSPTQKTPNLTGNSIPFTPSPHPPN